MAEKNIFIVQCNSFEISKLIENFKSDELTNAKKFSFHAPLTRRHRKSSTIHRGAGSPRVFQPISKYGEWIDMWVVKIGKSGGLCNTSIYQKSTALIKSDKIWKQLGYPLTTFLTKASRSTKLSNIKKF